MASPGRGGGGGGGGGRVLSVILIIDFDIFLNLKGKVWGGGTITV